jgi:hypothetical protein
MVKSRRLFLLASICIIDTNSGPNELIPIIGDSAYSHIDPFDGHTLWIVDENSGDCLSTHGFGACGDVNLWKWRTNGKKTELVMFESALTTNPNGDILGVDSDRHTAANGTVNKKSTMKGDVPLCLGRIMSIGNTHPETTLSPCSSRIASATTWEYDHETLMLSTATGVMSRFLGSLCIVRDGDKASTQNCNMGYTRLKLVIHTARRGEALDPAQTMQNELQVSNVRSHPIEYGEWTCSRTGLVFPRNLDDRLPAVSTGSGRAPSNHREDRQVLMGADIFTKVQYSKNTDTRYRLNIAHSYT